MVDNRERITPENLRAHPETLPVLLEMVVDRAVRYGFRATIARRVVVAFAPEELLRIYYAKRRETFLTLFAPLYYEVAGEPFLGPLFEGSVSETKGAPEGSTP